MWAARWNVGSLDLGSATLVAAGAVGFSVADDGALLYKLQPRRPYAWVWVDRSGSITPTAGPPQRLTDRAALSPDGRRVAFTATRSTEYPDLFIRDLETGADTTLTVRTGQRATERYRNPAWFPSGDRLPAAAPRSLPRGRG